MKEEILQIGRYGIVGVSSAGSYIVVVTLFSKMIGPMGAAMLGQILATAISYIGHRVFTFRSSAAHRLALPRFLIATAVSAAVNLGVTAFASSVLHMQPMMTSITAIGPIVLVSYAFNRFWTFQAA